jgi:hypothetical protein
LLVDVADRNRLIDLQSLMSYDDFSPAKEPAKERAAVARARGLAGA